MTTEADDSAAAPAVAGEAPREVVAELAAISLSSTSKLVANAVKTVGSTLGLSAAKKDMGGALEPLSVKFEGDSVITVERIMMCMSGGNGGASANGMDKEEARTVMRDMHKHMDKSHDGTVNLDELIQYAAAVRRTHIKKRALKRTIVGLLLALFASVVFNSALTASIVWTAKDTKTDTGSRPVLQDLDGNVVRTSPATVSLPLIAAPAMPLERLADVTSIKVTFEAIPPPDMYELPTPMVGARNVERIYSIIGVTKVSTTEVYFHAAEPGHRIHIQSGKANVTKVTNGVVEWTRKICESAVGCSALNVHTTEEVDTYIQIAESDLITTGDLPNSSAASSGRMLEESQVCSTEVCQPIIDAFNACDEADAPTETADAQPACVKKMTDALGVTSALQAQGLSIDCPSYIGAQPYTLEQTCSSVAAACPCLDIPTAVLCPGTCDAPGRRLSRATSKKPVEQHDSVSVPDDTLLLDAAFEGLATLKRKRKDGIINGRSLAFTKTCG